LVEYNRTECSDRVYLVKRVFENEKHYTNIYIDVKYKNNLHFSTLSYTQNYIIYLHSMNNVVDFVARV